MEIVGWSSTSRFIYIVWFSCIVHLHIKYPATFRYTLKFASNLKHSSTLASNQQQIITFQGKFQRPVSNAWLTRRNAETSFTTPVLISWLKWPSSYPMNIPLFQPAFSSRPSHARMIRIRPYLDWNRVDLKKKTVEPLRKEFHFSEVERSGDIAAR